MCPSESGGGRCRAFDLGLVAKVRLNFLRAPQSLRSATLPPFRSHRPPTSPEGDGGVDIRHRRPALKADGDYRTAPNES
jgi:hypothetical protein